MKKSFSVLAAAMLVMTFCTACGDDSSAADNSTADKANDSSASTTTSTEATAAAVTTAATEAVVFEDAIEAKSGDAYLAITDAQWYVQYWGKTEDLLTYDATVVPITGDGSYTVGVNAGTKGCKFDITQDPNGEYECEGLGFIAVMVADGVTLFPDMSIEITEIRVDGTPIEMTAKNYTSTDDGVVMRANIYNEWAKGIPEDAHTAEGPVAADSTEYSAQIIDRDKISKWTTVEVDFNVTGCGNAAAGTDNSDAPAETTTPAETTAAAE